MGARCYDAGTQVAAARGQMIIRLATQQDKETLWTIQIQAIRRMGLSHYSPEQVEAWAGGSAPDESHSRAIERHTTSIESGLTFVAEEADGAVVGFAALDSVSGEVSAVYVHPDYARRGIGRRLIEVIEQEARRLGLPDLHLRASLNAVKFYETVGFEYGTEMTHCFRSGVQIPCVIMTKTLTSDS